MIHAASIDLPILPDRVTMADLLCTLVTVQSQSRELDGRVHALLDDGFVRFVRDGVADQGAVPAYTGDSRVARALAERFGLDLAIDRLDAGWRATDAVTGRHACAATEPLATIAVLALVLRER